MINVWIIFWWIAHGGTLINIIDYITIAATGNAQDFGDLNVGTCML